MIRLTKQHIFGLLRPAAIALSAALSADAAVVFTGSQTTATAGSTINNIAALGTADWAIWDGAVGVPAQQKATANLVSNLGLVGTPGEDNFDTSVFSWASGGTPTASSAGFAAGVISETYSGALDLGEGFTVDLTLPSAIGTITFWGIGRNSGTNRLTVLDNGSNVVYSDDAVIASNSNTWIETTFTMNWSDATPNEVVTLNFLRFSGTHTSSRLGVSGIAVDAIPEPGSLALLGLGGLMIATRRRRG